MRWGLLIALMVFHTILFSIGLRWWHVLLADASLLACWVAVSTVRHHPASMFVARVVGALFELGIDAGKLDALVNKQLQHDALACFRAARSTANHRVFAVRFLLSLLADKSRPYSHELFRRSVVTQAIGRLRAWATEGKIPADIADTEIARLNAFLLD
jgi:hypothetical protein